MKTFIPKVDPLNRKWWVIDLDGANLGRTAVKVANILSGKNKPTFTPHLDVGDCVVAVNAKGLQVKGANKPNQLAYYSYSGYPGGLSKTTFSEQMQKAPERAFYLAVKRMLPKNRLGRKMFKKLFVYPEAEHPHKAQKPAKLEL